MSARRLQSAGKLNAYLCVGVDCQHVVDQCAGRRFKDGLEAIVEILECLESLIAVLNSEYAGTLLDTGDGSWRVTEVEAWGYTKNLETFFETRC